MAARRRALGSLLILLAAYTGAAPLSAQEWSGGGRATGRILDLEDRPVEQAEVTLRQVDLPGVGPPPVQSDAEGYWTANGLAAGRWNLAVKARGFRTSRGWLDVGDSVAAPGVVVALRPLAEVTPAFAESPGSALNWIDKANDLLEQGHPAEARQEYEKALPLLPLESRPEVLRALARTHFLEQDWMQTIDALQRALRIEPSDAATRRLYGAVMQELGRWEEAQSFLAALDRGEIEPETTTAAAPTTAAPPPAPAIARLPVVSAEADRRGRFHAVFDQRSPKGEWQELLRRLGLMQAEVDELDPEGGSHELADESFHVYVPQGEAPAEGFGLLVWISPLSYGGFVREEVRRFLEDHHLIWVGPHDAGNQRLRWYRVLLALDAVHNVRRLYPVDDRRVYAAGYSGGGRVTSALALLYPEVFRGGLSLFGCDYFAPIGVAHRPGSSWPASFPAPTGEALETLRRRSRFVLLTGELDFNRSQTRSTFKRMLADGFEHVLYLSIAGASHYHQVEREWLERSIRFLDGAEP